MNRIKSMAIDTFLVLLGAGSVYYGFSGQKLGVFITNLELFTLLGFCSLILLIKKIAEYILLKNATAGMFLNKLIYVDKNGALSIKRVLLRDTLLFVFLIGAFIYGSYNFFALFLLMSLPVFKNENNQLNLLVELIVGVNCVPAHQSEEFKESVT